MWSLTPFLGIFVCIMTVWPLQCDSRSKQGDPLCYLSAIDLSTCLSAECLFTACLPAIHLSVHCLPAVWVCVSVCLHILLNRCRNTASKMQCSSVFLQRGRISGRYCRPNNKPSKKSWFQSLKYWRCTTTFHALGTPLLLGNVVIANQKGTGPGSGNTNTYPLVDK